jgi:ATP-binding cassette subfamily C (CFTR/MRP) protein 4
VGLARAIYARPGVLLLDDPLAAVDSKVARNLYSAFRTHPALVGTTRILVTHQIQYAKECDTVLVLDHGRSLVRGPWDEVVLLGQQSSSSWLQFLMSEEDQFQKNAERNLEEHLVKEKNVVETDQVEVEDSNLPEFAVLEMNAAETTGEGSMSWKTLARFFIHPTSPWTFALAATFLIGGQALCAIADWYLAAWANYKTKEDQHGPKGTRTMVEFSILVAVASTVAVVRAIGCYLLILNSSAVVSKEMLRKVLDAPMGWFSNQPTGALILYLFLFFNSEGQRFFQNIVFPLGLIS